MKTIFFNLVFASAIMIRVHNLRFYRLPSKLHFLEVSQGIFVAQNTYTKMAQKNLGVLRS